MPLLQRFLSNHVLANATFVVVLVIGTLSFLQMPRSQDPEINFNWINVITILPGASALDVEKLITDPLEDALQRIPDIDFVSSTSREGASNILVRFNEISEREFDKRVNDLSREVQSKANSELPREAEDPQIFEITTANSLPVATLLVTGKEDDEILRRIANDVKRDLERIKGIDDIAAAALADPELHVEFYTDKLNAKGITPTQLADTVRAYFQDTAAGDLQIGNQRWLVRLIGTDSDPAYLGNLPIMGITGVVPIDAVAKVSRAREDAQQAVSYEGHPAVMLAITKRARVNTLDLIETINQYIESKNKRIEQFGVQVKLLDDQSDMTKKALQIMESNALLGLLLVAAITWVFLGSYIAIFIGLGIPFTMAGTFLLLNSVGETLNQSVLLAVVIVLGMLVDDAVVVVEAIYYRIQRGQAAISAAIHGLTEVFSPVTSSILTTIAVFLPLMLLPGILGDFMFVIPFVVTVALLISLVEAFWILPVHISMVNLDLSKGNKIQNFRSYWTHWLRINYCFWLIWVLRRPWKSMLAVGLLFALAVGSLAVGLVKVQFFAFDPIRLFYVNVEMQPGSTLQDTLKQVEIIEAKVRKHLLPKEIRGVSSVSGQMFTEMAPFFGDQFGQVVISLSSRKADMRSVSEIVDSMREDVMSTVGPDSISFLILEGGPPKGRPISVKVRGDDYAEIIEAVNDLRNILQSMPAVFDIKDDNNPGKLELRLRYDSDAIRRSGLYPTDITRIIRLLFDGDIVASMQHQGETLDVRVRAMPEKINDIDSILERTIALPQGGEIPIGQLVTVTTGVGMGNIRHYDFRRTITVEADLKKQELDTVDANKIIVEKWDKLSIKHPNINLDFSGELDDIQESLDSMLVLFILGVGLMYLILGTQFKSYFQPFMMLATIFMAFTGVVFGLIVSRNPLSLFTIYGVVALTGIAVNAAIVLIHAANQRLDAGMSVLHATVYAARRRVVPIIITSLTTVGGLLSLALGLGGKSLLWGPVASAIVWGLVFSTVLTLFVVPLLYQGFMRWSRHRTAKSPS